MSRGRWAEAEPVLVQAVGELRAIGALRRLPSVLLTLGAVRVMQDQVEEGDALAADAEAVARLGVDSRWLGLAITNRAALQLVLGDVEDGLRRLDEAERILARIEDRWVFHLVDAFRAALLASADRILDAELAAERAAAQLATHGGSDDELRIAVDGHVAWACVRQARATGADPEVARARVLAALAASPKSTAAWFLRAQLPADGG